MKRINRRDFEFKIEHGINVVVCTMDHDENCEKCINELDEYSKKIPEILFSEYDVMMDVDINERYEITYPPYILVFQDGKLINKFAYTNIDDFKKKIDF